MHSVSIVGCGYVGSRLARRWIGMKHEVLGFGSRPESLREISATGAGAKLLNLDQPLAEPLDFTDQLVYYTVPPRPVGTCDGRLAVFLAQIAGKPRRFVYLSTTGVYGDRAGALVDEDSEPCPLSARAVRRLAAENKVRAWAESHAVSWCILRVPGIYGPGRLPLERLRRGDPAINLHESTPSSRIHVNDLVSASVAAGRHPRADKRIYNVTDGSDDSLTAYLQRVARIGALPLPPLISRAKAEAEFSATTWSFLRESRRVDNRRLREELEVAIEYQNLDAGIRDSL